MISHYRKLNSSNWRNSRKESREDERGKVLKVSYLEIESQPGHLQFTNLQYQGLGPLQDR